MAATDEVLDCNGRSLALTRSAIMGVLNVTPDSFSDGGRWFEPADAVRHAVEMAAAGADIIDIGGESTRPGAMPVNTQQEIDRVIPVIEALHAALDIPISIDTSKPEVMAAAVAAGAGFINDVRALREAGAIETVARLEVPVCLMHMLGEPRTMQIAPAYNDVTAEVAAYLAARREACVEAGISAQRILLDPGFGFGKGVEHNLQLLRDLPALARLGAPLLVGLSRKSMLQRLLGLDVDERLHGSVALALIAVQNGARVVRVHDVAPTCQALRLWEHVAAGPQ
ncbi:MAG: dihydropteroate synthase [Gammaproteobacteria bacterium]|nr:dihydropteroate synthase [Gammaproteobacteria bacterium]MDH3465364.1 dihydropteroate synthase [Gammaproteobacteria bacterium]